MPTGKALVFTQPEASRNGDVVPVLDLDDRAGILFPLYARVGGSAFREHLSCHRSHLLRSFARDRLVQGGKVPIQKYFTEI
jgi:hypothetical protein